MSNSTWLPMVIARRAYRATSSTLGGVPAMLPAKLRAGDPFMEIPRTHLLSILESQIDCSLEGDYRLCLLLLEFDLSPSCSSLARRAKNEDMYSPKNLQKVSQILRRILNPIDIVVQYRSNALAVLLLDVESDNGVAISRRVQGAVSQETETQFTIGVSTVTSKMAQSLNAAEIVLSSAEINLKSSRKQMTGRAALIHGSQYNHSVVANHV